MKPKEFIAGLADAMQVESTELATVDRALAKQGLRQLARGRFHPDITLKEGVQLVCAWARATNLTQAADEVRRLELCVMPTDGLADSTLNEVVDPFGATLKDLSDSNILDAVTRLARQLGEKNYPDQKVSVTIEKNGPAEIFYGGLFDTKRLVFEDLPEKFEFKSPATVTVSVTIHGPVLKWIYDATEGHDAKA
ncbi:hypothetical protein [Lutimaribacter saemankumensis]|uniref:Uncharacterized protein n=1 Tax=Lutimaribacter saemankumensis TaxID=490829 RepID=A0A1G8SP57_9RHOB|nr:hypothetical protein [Lutimaribacter saemankumensis]SDJ31022.1 hypothetical protein SAMN05421850_1132 [Lutimaribacter saemankumensis]